MRNKYKKWISKHIGILIQKWIFKIFRGKALDSLEGLLQRSTKQGGRKPKTSREYEHSRRESNYSQNRQFFFQKFFHQLCWPFLHRNECLHCSQSASFLYWYHCVLSNINPFISQHSCFGTGSGSFIITFKTWSWLTCRSEI